jgi:hypothetical protein
MRERYIAPAIMLVAGAITSILNIMDKVELFDSLKRLLIVLIVFYILGKIAAKIIVKAIHIKNNPEVNVDENINDLEQIREE